MKFPRYKFYSDGKTKVIAVSSYAGRTVRGVAKCDPKDKFDLDQGMILAHKRCEMKINSKRLKKAEKEYQKAFKQVGDAHKRLEKMDSYLRDSAKKYKESIEDYEKLIENMGQ